MISINVWKVDYSIYDFCPINILDSRNQWNALSNLFLSLKPQHKIDRPLMIYLPESCGVCLWKSFGPVWLFATSWAVACQAPLSMGISQARTPDWLAISFSRGLSQPRDWTQVSCIAGRFFTSWAIREPPGMSADTVSQHFKALQTRWEASSGPILPDSCTSIILSAQILGWLPSSLFPTCSGQQNIVTAKNASTEGECGMV